MKFLLGSEKMSKWISVKDKLPDNEEVFLVYRGESKYPEIELAYWNLNRKRFEYYDNEYYGYGIDDITHWMPLPEPPKE